MTPFTSRRISSRQNFRTVVEPYPSDFVVPEFTARINPIPVFETNDVSGLDDQVLVDDMNSLTTTRQTTQKTVKKSSFSGYANRIWGLNDGTATISKQTLGEQKLREIFQQILDYDPPIKKVEFRRNSFHADPIKVLKELLSHPLDQKVYVDLSHNSFSISKIPDADEADGLVNFNIHIKL